MRPADYVTIMPRIAITGVDTSVDGLFQRSIQWTGTCKSKREREREREEIYHTSQLLKK